MTSYAGPEYGNEREVDRYNFNDLATAENKFVLAAGARYG
jgi:hypothetical protein